MPKLDPEGASADPPGCAANEETPAPRPTTDDVLARVLQHVALPEAQTRERRAPHTDTPGLRTALVRAVTPTTFVAIFRGGREIAVHLDDGVEAEVVLRAAEDGQRVLIESEAGDTYIVGVLVTRLTETLELRAKKIVIDAERELVLRSGDAGMRLSRDGDVELVGSRISTVSRGLFRLVGKMLRLN